MCNAIVNSVVFGALGGMLASLLLIFVVFPTLDKIQRMHMAWKMGRQWRKATTGR